jgi:hypothetical protein
VPQTVSIAIGAGLIAFVDYRLLLAFAALMGVIAAAYLLTRDEQRQPPPDTSASEHVARVTDAVDTVALPIV